MPVSFAIKIKTKNSINIVFWYTRDASTFLPQSVTYRLRFQFKGKANSYLKQDLIIARIVDTDLLLCPILPTLLTSLLSGKRRRTRGVFHFFLMKYLSTYNDLYRAVSCLNCTQYTTIRKNDNQIQPRSYRIGDPGVSKKNNYRWRWWRNFKNTEIEFL